MLGRFSLRTRLVVGVLVLALLGLVAADVATYTSLRSFLVQRVDATLQSDHQSFEQGGGNGNFGGPGAGPSNEFAQWRARNGTTVLATHVNEGFGDSSDASQPRLPKTISMQGAKTSTDGQDVVRYFTVPATRGGDRFRVRASFEGNNPNAMLVTATSLHDVDSTLSRLALIELLVTGAVLLALGVGGFWVVRLGLRPLNEIERTAGAIAAGDLSRRVERADERTEVGRLGLALNTMLGRIESAFKAQEASERKLRRFVADASHELRTPLALLRTELEVALRRPRSHDELEAALRSAAEETERLVRLAEDLLLIARAEEGALPIRREATSTGELLERVRRRFAGRAASLGRGLRVEPGNGLVVDADPARVEQALGNLVDNALQHGAGAVTLAARAQNGHVELHVTDEGGGFPERFVERAFDRFSRADEARSAGGTGLGLSIVTLIASAHGGRAHAANRPQGGADVWLEL